jgi:hypothetical protein
VTGALSFCTFSLGLFLERAVRPLGVTAMRDEPVLIGLTLTRISSRYNILALALSGLCLILEIMSPPSLRRLLLEAALTTILALKRPFDNLISHRQRAGHVRRIGVEGKP